MAADRSNTAEQHDRGLAVAWQREDLCRADGRSDRVVGPRYPGLLRPRSAGRVESVVALRPTEWTGGMSWARAFTTTAIARERDAPLGAERSSPLRLDG